jgi:hypothetical protein
MFIALNMIQDHQRLVLAHLIGPIFTLESSVLSSLYMIAINCRDPIIRRKAIELFTTAPCQEGVWEGALFAQFVKEVADLEKMGARSRCTNGVFEAGGVREEEERFSDVVFAVTDDPKVGRLVCARFLIESTEELVVWEHLFRY